MVETKIEVACKVPTNLHRKGWSPKGQYWDRSSTRVRGIVTRHNRRSEIARLMMKTFLAVLIAGFLMTATTTREFPVDPRIISRLYTIMRA